MKKRILIFAIAALFLLPCFSLTGADPGVAVIDISQQSVVITASGYSLGGGAEIGHTGTYQITGETDTNTITVRSGSPYIIFNGADIAPASASPVTVMTGAAPTIGTDAASHLTAPAHYAAIAVPAGAAVTIVDGTETLYLVSSDGAGIGGNGGATVATGIAAGGEACGTVNIIGGKLSVTSVNGAGIGGGAGGSATSSGSGGNGGDGGAVYISGGSPHIVSSFGAAIGGGAGGNGDYGGGGAGGSGKSLNVSGGKLTVESNGYAAAIGGGAGGRLNESLSIIIGNAGNGGAAEFTGGNIFGIAAHTAPVIGGGAACDSTGMGFGNGGNGATLKITGGCFNLKSLGNGIVIGGGKGGSGNTSGSAGSVTIDGGSIRLISSSAVLIGGGDGSPAIPLNSDGAQLYQVRIKPLSLGLNESIASGGSVGGLTYGFRHVRTDADDGFIYLWLPSAANSATVNGVSGFTGTVETDGSGIFKLDRSFDITINGATCVDSCVISAGRTFTLGVTDGAASFSSSSVNATVAGTSLITNSIGEAVLTAFVPADDSHYEASKTLTLDIEFGEPAPAPTLTLRNKTDTAIIFEPISDGEYSSNNGLTWQPSNTFGGLTPDTDYSFIARIRFNAELQEESVACAPVNVRTLQAAQTAPLLSLHTATTSVVILNPITGAEYSSDGGTTWQDASLFSGLSSGSTYNFVARIKYDSDTQMPSVNSNTVTVRIKYPAYEAPLLELDSKTDTTVKLKRMTDTRTMEFSSDNGATWSSDNDFTDLTPNTAYTFIARFRYDPDDRLESAVSAPLTVTTYGSANAAPTLSFISKTDTAVTLNTIANAEYSADGGETWQDGSTFTALTEGTEYSFVARIKYDSDTRMPSINSNTVTVTTYLSAYDAPALALDKKTDTTIKLARVIDGVKTMEFSADNGATWSSNNDFTELLPGSSHTYIARFRYDSATRLPSVISEPLTITTFLPALEAPTLLSTSKTDTSVHFAPIADAEYSSDGGATWQDSPDFIELTPATAYGFTARMKFDPLLRLASINSPVQNITTFLPAYEAPLFEIDTLSDVAVKFKRVADTRTMEFSADGINWSSSNDFTDLVPLTEYTFYARFRFTADRAPSLISSMTLITYLPAAEAPDVDIDSITNDTATLTPVEGAEYSIDGGVTWQDSNIFTGLTETTSYTFTARMKYDPTTHMPSKLTTITASTLLPPYEAPVIVIDTLSATNIKLMRIPLDEAGTIVMEFTMDRLDWSRANDFTGLTPGTTYTVYARYRADLNTRAPGLESTLEFTTLTLGAAAPEISVQGITDTTILLSPVEGAEYSSDGGETWQDSSLFEGLLPATEYAFTARIKFDEAVSLPSESSPLLHISTREEGYDPNELALVYRSSFSISVLPVPAAEYTIDDGAAWQSEAIFDNLLPLTEYKVIARIPDITADDGYAYTNPLTVSTLRAPIAADPTQCAITGVVDSYDISKRVSFTAVGVATEVELPIEGDTRIIPVSWTIGTDEGSWESEPYTDRYTCDTAGSFKLVVTFRTQRFDGSAWVDTDTTNEESVSFKVNENESVITGDSVTFTLSLAAVALVSLAVLLIILAKKRRRTA